MESKVFFSIGLMKRDIAAIGLKKIYNPIFTMADLLISLFTAEMCSPWYRWCVDVTRAEDYTDCSRGFVYTQRSYHNTQQ